jgi:S-adenosylmethionine decarboxylase
MNEPDSYTGEHWLVEFHDAQALDDLACVTEALRSAADAGGVHLLRLDTHHFGDKQGVTGVALLAESHISIHTWPEHGYAAIDLFFCGRHTKANDAIGALRKALRPARESVQTIKRGYSLKP